MPVGGSRRRTRARLVERRVDAAPKVEEARAEARPARVRERHRRVERRRPLARRAHGDVVRLEVGMEQAGVVQRGERLGEGQRKGTPRVV